jgi:hypothetical protein
LEIEKNVDDEINREKKVTRKIAKILTLTAFFERHIF